MYYFKTCISVWEGKETSGMPPLQILRSRNVNSHQKSFLNRFNKGTKSYKDIISKSQLIFKFQGDVSLLWNPYIIHKSLQREKKTLGYI